MLKSAPGHERHFSLACATSALALTTDLPAESAAQVQQASFTNEEVGLHSRRRPEVVCGVVANEERQHVFAPRHAVNGKPGSSQCLLQASLQKIRVLDDRHRTLA